MSVGFSSSKSYVGVSNALPWFWGCSKQVALLPRSTVGLQSFNPKSFFEICLKSEDGFGRRRRLRLVLEPPSESVSWSSARASAEGGTRTLRSSPTSQLKSAFAPRSRDFWIFSVTEGCEGHLRLELARVQVRLKILVFGKVSWNIELFKLLSSEKSGKFWGFKTLCLSWIRIFKTTHCKIPIFSWKF